MTSENPQIKKKKATERWSEPPTESKAKKKKTWSKKPSADELDTLFKTLNSCKQKASIPRILPTYAPKFKLKSLELPIIPLTSLYDKSTISLPIDELILKWGQMFSNTTLSPTDTEEVEKQTRGQNQKRNCSNWDQEGWLPP